MKNKDFSQTKGSKEIKNFWIRRADSFAAFCIDEIREDFEGQIVKDTLRRKYQKYCRNHKVKGTTDKFVKEILQERYNVGDDKIYENETQIYLWSGIKFRSEI